MGEGFVVMQSNDVDIYYYQDEPGELMRTERRCGQTQIVQSDTAVGRDGFSLSRETGKCVCGRAGLVPVEQESAEEAETSSEDDKLQDLPPCWGLDIVCGKGTDFNYGPWADRQRWGKCQASPSEHSKCPFLELLSSSWTPVEQPL